MNFSKEEINSYIKICREGYNYNFYSEIEYSDPISLTDLVMAKYALEQENIEPTHWIFNTELVYEMSLGFGKVLTKGVAMHMLDVPAYFTDNIPYNMGIIICLLPGIRRPVGPSGVCVFNAGNLDPQKAKLMLTFK